MTDRTLSEFLGDFGKSFVDSVKSQVSIDFIETAGSFKLSCLCDLMPVGL